MRAVHPGRSACNHLHSLAAANGIAHGPGGVMSAQSIRLLDSRLRATGRSEWIKFRSVRSSAFALAALR